jgi:cytosine/adenosine deaminase-related metal-dependent hydrolase
MSADLIAINLDRPALAGAEHDPVAALVLCQIDAVDYSFIHGRRVVDRGVLTTVQLPQVLHQARRLAAEMMRGPDR